MTKIITLNKFNPDKNIISQAADIIKSGNLVAFPTETVYGLGADALNSNAVKKIFAAKGRPSDNPLILHISNINQVKNLAYENAISKKIMNFFFPAPLTLVLNAKNIIPEVTRGGLDTVAIRMPNNPIALALIEKANTPIAAPSANLSGRPSPTDSKSVFNDMNGKIDLILDGGGLTDIGIESTVIDVTNPEKIFLLRPGAMPVEIIENFLNTKILTPDNSNDNSNQDKQKRSPGTRYRHYAPSVPVKIFNPEIFDSDFQNSGFIGLHKPDNFTFKKYVIFDNIENYARGLFFAFRELEVQNINSIFVELVNNSGLGRGLQDRILRASGFSHI